MTWIALWEAQNTQVEMTPGNSKYGGQAGAVSKLPMYETDLYTLFLLCNQGTALPQNWK